MSELINGQIIYNSELGKIISDIVKQDNIKNIVEIGTWYGMGTTHCIRKAIIDSDKKNYEVFSFESCLDMWKVAIENNQPILPNFKILLGGIVEEKDFFDFNSIDDKYFSEYSRAVQKKWYDEDLKNCKINSNYFAILPQKIDLLILDGGEFSTYGEYNLLKNRFNYLIVDDTKALKGDKIREELLVSNDVLIIQDEINKRNGFLTCRRKV